MARINLATKEIHCKIVYYGPTYAGKTANLLYIHDHLPQHLRSELLTLATETERIIFFDCCHPQIPKKRGLTLRFHVYTIPRNVLYRKSKQKVLTEVDGIVFIATSERTFFEQNTRDFDELVDILAMQNKDIHSLPFTLQLNKRDIVNAVPLEVLNAAINGEGWPAFTAVATEGVGVLETFEQICKLTYSAL